MRSRMVVSFTYKDDVIVPGGGTFVCDFRALHLLKSVRVGFRDVVGGWLLV